MNKKKILGILLMMPITITMLFALYIIWEFIWIFVLAILMTISTAYGIRYLVE